MKPIIYKDDDRWVVLFVKNNFVEPEKPIHDKNYFLYLLKENIWLDSDINYFEYRYFEDEFYVNSLINGLTYSEDKNRPACIIYNERGELMESFFYYKSDCILRKIHD